MLTLPLPPPLLLHPFRLAQPAGDTEDGAQSSRTIALLAAGGKSSSTARAATPPAVGMPREKIKFSLKTVRETSASAVAAAITATCVTHANMTEQNTSPKIQLTYLALKRIRAGTGGR